MLPQMTAKQDALSIINQFHGVNKGYMIADSELSNSKNITNDNFPILTNRKRRGIINVLNNPNGMIGGRYLVNVLGNRLYYNQKPVCSLKDLNEERQLVIMGANIVVFPDGIVYNTYDATKTYIENTTTVRNVTITLSNIDGTAYTSSNTVVGSSNTDTSKYWLDTSSNPVVLKQYSASTSKWVSVPTSYVKFSGTNIGKGFKAYDAVHFEGVDTGSWIYNDYDFNAQSMIVYAAADDYLICSGLINMTHTNSKTVTVKRKLPQMDYVCELNNRIWGCSTENHEIYACKQGDPTNWDSYAGLDSDSYAATVGTQNVFTGCVSYRGYVYFFKEDGYHKVYGSKPSNYEISWNSGRGVQEGSSKSICVAGDSLMYKAREGICIFDGSGTVVSDKLGANDMFDAVAGSYRNKYYVSMRDKDNNYTLYVYDTSKNTWIIEEEMKCRYMATTNNGLYIIDYDNVLYCLSNEVIYVNQYPKASIFPSDGTYLGKVLQQSEFADPINPGDDIFPSETEIYPVDNTNTLEPMFEWSFETADFGTDDPYHEYIKRIIMRIWLDVEAKMRVEIMYDSSGEWINLMEYYATRKRSYEIPMVIERCDHCKLRISGFGDFRLYSIAKAIEEGSSR